MLLNFLRDRAAPLLGALLLWPGLAVHAAEPAAASPRSGTWAFKALLDGSPIGQHRFTLRDGELRELKSEATFDVKILGFSAYHYHHEVTEHWQGDCLHDLSSKTDDDGKPSAVQLRKAGDKMSLKAPAGEQTLDGCVMTFAYWNPLILRRTQLLDPQTGRYEKVKIEALENGSVDVHGKPEPARHYRISGPENPIELWYSMQGDWIGLDSMVSDGKRKLSYRLE